MFDCHECERHSWPKGCVGKEWFSFSEICWCRFQLVWLIKNLEGDTWPPNPEESSYVDTQIRTGYASEGHFVKPASILAEVNYRLKRCGTDGKLLKAEIMAELELSPEAKTALNYCSGFNRKRPNYMVWKKKRKFRRKRDQKVPLKREAPS